MHPTAGATAALHGATAGNPLFSGELIRRLHDDGGVERFANRDDVPITSSVRAVLGVHLAALELVCRELLEVAAVCGGEFSADLVAAATGRPLEDALATLDVAIAGKVVVTSEELGRSAFAHPLLRSVLQDEIGVARRVRLRHAVALALEDTLGRGGRVDVAVLSSHHMSAATMGSAGKAAEYALAAARAARAAHSYEAAVGLYERALAANALDPVASDRGPPPS